MEIGKGAGRAFDVEEGDGNAGFLGKAHDFPEALSSANIKDVKGAGKWGKELLEEGEAFAPHLGGKGVGLGVVVNFGG
jgi:hypothetical protein